MLFPIEGNFLIFLSGSVFIYTFLINLHSMVKLNAVNKHVLKLKFRFQMLLLIAHNVHLTSFVRPCKLILYDIYIMKYDEI